jgi:hypothetical protein
MTDNNFFWEVEPDHVKVVIPISFYVPDENWIDPELEVDNFLFTADLGEEPEFVKMVIPISAYEQDEHLSYRDFDPDIFIAMVGKSHTAQILKPDQPAAMM